MVREVRRSIGWMRMEIGKENSLLVLRKFASGPDFCPSAPFAEATGGMTRVKWPESVEEIPLGSVRARSQKLLLAIHRDHHGNVEALPLWGEIPRTQGRLSGSQIKLLCEFLSRGGSRGTCRTRLCYC